MNLDINSPEFFDKDALKEETLRVFDICNSCRLCFKYCGSFPYLFDALDRKDQDVKRLSDDEIRKVEELCFQCKICYFECPYHPPHKYMLDFPRLILRLRAARARSEGVKLNDTLLGATEALGKIGSLFPFLMNFANRSGALRKLSAAFTGIHPDRKLPEFRFETFERWWNRRERRREREVSSGHGHEEKRAALFYTCTVNYNRPEIGIAAVKLLEHNGVKVAVPRQRCCGMPRLDCGDINAALEQVKENTMSLIPYVNQGYDIVGLGPTCTYMLKFEYRELLPCEETRKISEHAFDICEYLMKLNAAGRLKRDFKKGAGRVGYHLPCHLKAQNLGYKSRDLLKLMPDTKVQLIDRCSIMDGTWGMKREHYEESMRRAGRLFEDFSSENIDIAASDCQLASLQIEQGTGRAPRHPVEIICDACGL